MFSSAQLLYVKCCKLFKLWKQTLGRNVYFRHINEHYTVYTIQYTLYTVYNVYTVQYTHTKPVYTVHSGDSTYNVYSGDMKFKISGIWGLKYLEYGEGG